MRIQLTTLASVLTAVSLISAAEVKLGKPLAVKDPVSIQALLSHAGNYVGKTVQVKGRITEVCQMAGCWMELTNDDGQLVRIKVNDGDIVFPKDAAGKEAVAEGKFARIELTRAQAVAQAKEEADEKGRKFDPASVKGGITIYQIEGTGAVIQ
ncbi:MAG TPA: DUF4920 domain-containing protein [Candidatus Acidoferrales bacterium]|jgi:hypothetical protein|nr:DUF4920 domain-containing protein [Candidatus Acidoferrales bacterium]